MTRQLPILILMVCGQAFSGFAATLITSSSAAPATITFTAGNPDSPTVAGSSLGTITFATNAGSNANVWNVQVQATAANFASCPTTVPVTAVRVTCTSASVSRGGGTGICAGPFNLSTGMQTVASGTEGTGSGVNRPTYAVSLNFTFTDSWAYIAAACSVNLNYLITAN